MTKKRKSIVSSFGDFASQDSEAEKGQPTQVEAAQERQPTRVGAGIIGATKRTLTDIREERDRLLAAVEDNDTLLKLNPNDIDPSPFRDRLPDDSDDDFDLFKSTLKEEGQKVPITVRRHPDKEHRYQIVFGHRRARALKDLGKNVSAQLVDYSDRDLVVAQGIENASRQDLSWIEKAMFVARMEREDIKPKDIKSALSVDDAQISKFRVVTRALSFEIIEAIGRAPSIGRPRWLELAERAKDKRGAALVSKTLSVDKVSVLSSDNRFLAALSALSIDDSAQRERPVATTKNLEGLGELTVGSRGIQLSIDKKYHERFALFFDQEIDGLVSKFMDTMKDEN